MADEETKKGEVRFTVSAQLWAYLGWLSKNTVLGKSEQDVAKHIITQRLSEMRKENYVDNNGS